MVQLDQLRILVAIANTGSLAAAGRSLYISQPTVSHHLGALEADIGGRLVDRGPSGARLTELGVLVASHAATILAGVARIERDALSHGLGTVSVGSFPSAATALLLGPLARLHERRLGFRLLVAEPHEVAAGVRQLAFDVAIIASERGSRVAVPDAISTSALLDDPLLVVLPPGHRLLAQRALVLADLIDETWIATTRDDDAESTLLRRIFADSGRDFEPQVRADDFSVTQALVATGLGLSLLPRLAIGQIASGAQTRRVADKRFARRIHIAWRDGRPGVNQLVDDIRQVASEQNE